MKKFFAVCVALAACAALAIPAFAATKTVTLHDNYFGKHGAKVSAGVFKQAPMTLTVAKGTTVKWVWSTKLPHNIVGSGAAKFTSGAPKKKGSFSRKLTKAGVYKILCVVHAPGMKMTIKVK
jgi:plastocyanin